MEPVTGTEAIIEEAFVDVFCDLVYGGGWMDTKREDIDRECNWALVRIGGCLGHRRSNYLAPSTDRIQVPSASAIHYFRRHGHTYIHERFPLRRVCATRIPPTLDQESSVLILLSGGDQAVEMSDYTEHAVVSHVPKGQKVEFEGLLRGSNSSMKVISLGRDGLVKRDVNHVDAVSSRSRFDGATTLVGPGNEPYCLRRRHLFSYICSPLGKRNSSPRYPDDAK